MPNFLAVSWTQNYRKIPTSFIKPAAELLTSPIIFTSNNFIELDQFPYVRTVAKLPISPIHKINQPTELKNYRPLSVWPVILKIYESVVLENITKFIGEKSIYHQYQSGNCKNHSTARLVTKLRDDIKRASKNTEVTLVVFTHYSKVFDTIDFPILIKRIITLDFSERFLYWIFSYFTNRRYFA